jgi:hypothetical protein
MRNKLQSFINSLVFDKNMPPHVSFCDDPRTLIFNKIFNDPSAVLISRIGGVEASSVYKFLQTGHVSNQDRLMLQRNAGFYYSDSYELEHFAIENIDALLNSDVLAYWNSPYQFELLKKIGVKAEAVRLRSLELFWPENFWLDSQFVTQITIVSPFSETMILQQKNMAVLHPSLNLKNCSFSFVKSPMTNGVLTEETLTVSWFARLDEMFAKVVNQNPHIVLIGAGAYGLVLANRLKNSGINAVVCGGALQLLFGIQGLRWDQRADYQQLFNEFWVRPLENERPVGHDKIEGGCYW